MTPPLLMALLLGATPNPPSLEALVTRLGEEEKARSAQTCAFVERTAVHELDSDGNVKGSVIREFDVTFEPTVHRRALRSETFEGDPSRLLKKRPEDTADKPQPGPFHPDEQPHYTYALVSHEGARAVIRYTPKEPHEKRMKGTAVVNVPKARLLRMEMEPSENPKFVKSLKMDVTLADTACGQRMVKVTAKGAGGMLFMKVRFRTESTISGFKPGGGAAKAGGG